MRPRFLCTLHKRLDHMSPTKYCTIMQSSYITRHFSDLSKPIPHLSQPNNTTYLIAAAIASGGTALGYYQLNSPQVQAYSDDGDDDIPDDIFAFKPVRKVSPSEIIGEIDLHELNKYDQNHTRQLISIYGTIFDVTESKDKYGPDGSYRVFSGHDITLALASGCLNAKHMDLFVRLDEINDKLFIADAQSWFDFYKKKYPVVGRLNKWNEDQSTWALLTPSKKSELTRRPPPPRR
eukprot:524080_1